MGLAGVATALLGLGILVSHSAPCGPPDPLPEGATPMAAITYHCYGSVEVLRVSQVARPVPADHEVLVRVHAASLNPQEWHYMQGKPYVMRLSAGLGRPRNRRLGGDFAGTVEAVGRSVVGFRPGDEVFGSRWGAFAEYLTVSETRVIAKKPANVSFEEAAGVAVAATTALQAVRDQGRVQPGQRVLINGASGGVGTFAVQLARFHGAHVTGVSSTRNLELVRSLGAHHMIDYTQQDFTHGVERYDVIIDMVGNHPLGALRRVLHPDGTVVIVGGARTDPWLGPLSRGLRALAYSPLVSQRFAMFIAELRPEDLHYLAGLLESGEMRTVIDGRFTLAEVPAGMAYLEQGRTRGKNVILLLPPQEPVEEVDVGLHRRDPVLPSAEPVPLVLEDQVFHVYPSLPRRLHQPVVLVDGNPDIVGTGGHEERAGNPVGMEER
jgi:NADPH:quinone reductase-like Zn-dependent oxidoreductase